MGQSCGFNLNPFTLFFILIIVCCLIPKIVGSEDKNAEENEVRPGGSYVYRNTRPSENGQIPVWDPNGYVFFCLCMGILAS